MKILKELEKKNVNESKYALFIRHSDRYEIKSSEFGNDVLLNEQGIKNAVIFGKYLKQYKINKIYTSPIERCVQTAENIIKGYENKIEIIKTKALGDPGIHIYDDKLLGDYYLKYGFWKIFENFKKNIPVAGLYEKDKVKEKFQLFIKQNTTKKGLTLFISHDWQIAFYAYMLNIKEFTVEDWINYLDGLILNIE